LRDGATELRHEQIGNAGEGVVDVFGDASVRVVGGAALPTASGMH
jgi:hypothetical protein